ncbi:MAG: PDC sensor domain-containing protein, partial [Thermodesulfobacteriota bacterium]|nr:PDC sensor domain-containing protein [Thermodesulfobacteriota bacterium]
MDSIKKEAFNKLTAIRDLKVEQVNDWFDERLGYITTVSKDFEIRSLDKPLLKTYQNMKDNEIISNARKILNRYLKNYTDYVELFIINPFSGIVEISTDPSQEGKDNSEEIYFIEPLKKSVPYIKGVYFSKTLNKPSISFSVPINCQYHNGDHIIGVLVATIDPDRSLYPLLLNRTGMGETGEALILNKDRMALNE